MNLNFRVTKSTRDDSRRYSEHDNRAEAFRQSEIPRGRGRGRGRGYNPNYRGRGNFKSNYQPTNVGFTTGFRGSLKNLRGRGKDKFAGGRMPGTRPRYRDEDDEGDSRMSSDSQNSGSERHRFPYRRAQSRLGFRPGETRTGVFNKAINSIGVRNDGSARVENLDGMWYIVIIPNGINYSKDFIISSIKNLCEDEFTVHEYRNDAHGAACFTVQGGDIAEAIKATSRRITFSDGFKMMVNVKKTIAPKNMPLSDDNIDKLKISMSDRYDVAAKFLDLENLYHDKNLNKSGIRLPLNKPNVMTAILNIIIENIPEIEGMSLKNNILYDLNRFSEHVSRFANLKTLDLSDNKLNHLNYVDSFSKIEELQLKKNPVAESPSDLTYVSMVRKTFPNLLKLDGVILPPLISFDLGTTTELPPTLGNVFIVPEAKEIVIKFVNEYFGIFDSSDRQKLIGAYHENAVFSMSAFNRNDSNRRDNTHHDYGGLSAYFLCSRNQQRLQDPIKRHQQLQVGHHSIVSLLSSLPATTHDMNSFVVDVSAAETSVLYFTLTGVFKETESKAKYPQMRSFSRVFVCIPHGGGIVIANEEWTITNTSAESIKKFFKSPAPTPSPSPVLGSPPNISGPSVKTNELSLEQKQVMVQKFAQDSKMNLVFSEQCLSEQGWNYKKAADTFTRMHAEAKIPPEAFQ